jgi:poly(A) polymerase
MSKVYHTACCIIPPQEIWSQIQNIRSKYDSAFQRWMPHINLLFPFIHQNQFEQEAEKLKQSLSMIKPFTVRLEMFQHFEHGKKCVMWLQPIDIETNDSTKVKQVQEIVESVFPHCTDSSREYTPHLTLGQFGKKEIERKKKRIFR